jgi:aromatic ring-cleaving dioxygenase
MSWDRVYTVHDYYDGPRRGIADVDGVPHIYEAEFDHSSDDYGDTYFVSPFDESLLALILEDWETWLRWNSAFKRGEVSIESHPARPEDRARHEALKVAIGDRLKVDRAQARYMKAKVAVSPQDGGTIVEWCAATE